MTTWQIGIDVALVLAVLVIVFIGIKRGLVKSFFKSTKFLIVIVITALIGSCFVGLCEEHIVGKFLEGKISDAIVQKAQGLEGDIDVEQLTSSMPEAIQAFIPTEDIEEYLGSLKGEGQEMVVEFGQKVEDIAIKSLSETLSYVITFVLVFIVYSILILLIEKIFDLPVLSGLNKIGGAIWGLCSAYLFVSSAVLVVLWIFGLDFIEGTIVTRILYKIGLFTL